MAGKDLEFQKRLLATFAIEAREHLAAISSGLMQLEKAGPGAQRAELIETVFREAHSLKGAARAVDLSAVTAASHHLEGVFAAMKRGELAPSPELFDVLHRAHEQLRSLIEAPAAALSPEEQAMAAELARDLGAVVQGAVPVTSPRPPHPASAETPAGTEATIAEPPSVETVRVAATKLNAMLQEAEELTGARLAAAQRAADLREAAARLAERRAAWRKAQPYVRALQKAMDRDRGREGNGRDTSTSHVHRHLPKLLAFLEAEQSTLQALETMITGIGVAARHDERALGKTANALLDDARGALMLPLSALLEALPALVRSLCRDRGKEADLVVRGGEQLELDRRVLEQIKDPLLHVVRNCIDHGIESAAEREQKGKPRRGMITIAIAQKESGKAEIAVSDDGAGIDTAQVRASALKLGIVPDEALAGLSADAVRALVFRSGLSTSPILTDVSGRGLGLAIVQEKAEKLGGGTVVESSPGAGTTIRITVPLTLALFQGLIVRVGEHMFVLPSAKVERVARIAVSEIATVENRDTITLGDVTIAAVYLSDVLELPRVGARDDAVRWVQTVVLESGGGRIAFLVDEVLGMEEVLVKKLGPQLSRVRNVSGASMLGSGMVVPILDVADLMRSAVRTTPAAVTPAPIPGEETRRTSVLVVEDSITARALLKNILELAGYEVTTAVDGIDAFTRLKSGEFDIVVSDVEMPRMNGFDLAAGIRADSRLAELPVVLVTALETREDRERGIDVGANAYIVKSSFDQSNLLDVMGRLV